MDTIRSIKTNLITETVARLCQEANFNLGEDVLYSFQKAYEQEVSIPGRRILQNLIKNAEIAQAEGIPICQDTGFAVVFLELGQDVHLEGGDFYAAINEGVRKGYREGYLRKSIVRHPLERKNTGDNTPAIIHTKIIPGEDFKIRVLAKGCGSENTSAVKMLKPSEGVEGVKKFIINVVKEAGSNACPPVIVGVGIGGNFEKVSHIAKEALLRPVGEKSSLANIARLEAELLEEINNLGIGPLGIGGKTTALAVHIEIFATHIAGLPVAVNLSCHASRHKSAIL